MKNKPSSCSNLKGRKLPSGRNGDLAEEDLLVTEYPSSAWMRTLRSKSLSWFKRHQRDLPWRTDNTLYRVWISEIMLQQTQVQTVVDYFNRFIEHFPDISALAAAPESQVLSLWEGLGYYRRARSLHAAAKQIVKEHAGQFPNRFDDVINLPGIGRYTAGAILSISLDQSLPILEGNTYRLYARLLGLSQDPRERSSENLLWKFATDILPKPNSKQRAGQLNQALMEIGSEVCKVKNPVCASCPLQSVCAAHQRGLENEIPRSNRKTNYEDLHQALFIIEDGASRALVRKRSEGEWWSGLWDFVRFDLPSQPKSGPKRTGPKRTGKASSSIKSIAEKLFQESGIELVVPELPDFSFKHAVTRYRIRLDCYHVRGAQIGGDSQYQLKNINTIKQLPLNVTARKALNRVWK